MRTTPLALLLMMLAVTLFIIPGGVFAFENDKNMNIVNKSLIEKIAEEVADRVTDGIDTVKDTTQNVIDLIKALPKAIWDYFVEKIFNGIISIFDGIASFIDKKANDWNEYWAKTFGYDEEDENTLINTTARLIFGTFILLVIFGLVRFWVWLLNVFPVA